MDNRIKPLRDGQGDHRKNRDGKLLYEARPYAAGSVPRYTSGTLQHVRDFVARIEHENRTGSRFDDRKGREPVASYAERWLGTLAHKQQTADRVRSLYKCHFLAVVINNRKLGDYQMLAVSHSDIAGWLAMEKGVLAPRTLRGLRQYVWRMFDDAIHDGVLDHSPCTAVKKPKVGRLKVQVMTAEEIDQVAAFLPARWRALATVGRMTGLRPSELLGLSISRVDFFGRTIRVDRQMLLGKFAELKNDGSERTVLVEQPVLDAIALHLAQYPAGQDGLIFTNRDGGGLYTSMVARAWRTAAAKAGVRPGTHPHGLRHHYASAMMAAPRPDPAFVAAQVGHSDPAVTWSTYTHPLPDREQERRETLRRVFG